MIYGADLSGQPFSRFHYSTLQWDLCYQVGIAIASYLTPAASFALVQLILVLPVLYVGRAFYQKGLKPCLPVIPIWIV